MAPNSLESEAQKKFRRAIEKAKREGVDVDAYFIHLREQFFLAFVKPFGVLISIVATFLVPYYVLNLKIQCVRDNLDVYIPAEMAYWLSAVSFVSMIAFAYDLVNPRTLEQVQFWKKKELALIDETPRYEVSTSGRFKRIQANHDEVFGEIEYDDDEPEGVDGDV